MDEARCVPNLVAEVAGRLYALVRETHIVSGAVAGREGEAQRIRAVLVDDLQRVDAVAERLGHLAALRVAHQTVDKDGLERGLAHVLHTGEDHARNPEEDDVVAGDQRIGRVEIVKLLGLVRPAERGERPQRGARTRYRAHPPPDGYAYRRTSGRCAHRSWRRSSHRSRRSRTPGCGDPTTADAKYTSRVRSPSSRR